MQCENMREPLHSHQRDVNEMTDYQSSLTAIGLVSCDFDERDVNDLTVT